MNDKDMTVDVVTDIGVKDSDGLAVAYCRIPRGVAGFLKYTNDQYGAIGLSYDFEANDREIGVIIKAGEPRYWPEKQNIFQKFFTRMKG